MYCPSCGTEYTQKIKYCTKCGSNMSLTASTVELHMPQPRMTGMVWAIALFSFLGFIASLIMLGSMYNGREDILITFVFCLAFVFSISGLLVWQLARLISTFRDAVRQTINRAQTESITPSPSFSSQAQPANLPAAHEPIRSVTEHTTRSINPALYSGPGKQ